MTQGTHSWTGILPCKILESFDFLKDHLSSKTLGSLSNSRCFSPHLEKQLKTSHHGKLLKDLISARIHPTGNSKDSLNVSQFWSIDEDYDNSNT